MLAVFERLRKWFGGGVGEVLGGGGEGPYTASAAPGEVGAVSDPRRGSKDELADGAPSPGDDEFTPEVPPDRPE
jgi:hypothetical protein